MNRVRLPNLLVVSCIRGKYIYMYWYSTAVCIGLYTRYIFYLGTCTIVHGSLLLYDCERSELLIWQVHQFELRCFKLHTTYRYNVHPKLYSDWSMCTVFFLRIEFTAVQRCARTNTQFASGSKIVDENKGDMENFLVTQDSTHRGFC